MTGRQCKQNTALFLQCLSFHSCVRVSTPGIPTGKTDFPRNCFVIQRRISSDRVVVVVVVVVFFIFLSVDRKKHFFFASLQIKKWVERENFKRLEEVVCVCVVGISW